MNCSGSSNGVTFFCKMALAEAALIFSKVVAASAKPKMIILKVQSLPLITNYQGASYDNESERSFTEKPRNDSSSEKL